MVRREVSCRPQPDVRSPHQSPGRQSRRLPDSTIVSAEIDPLRSEGEAFSNKLEAAGSEVRHHTFKGVTHEFFGMGLVVKDAAAAEQMVAHNLKRAFGTAILPI